MIEDRAKAWLDNEVGADSDDERAENRDYSYADMLDAYAAGAMGSREPTDKMIEQGLVYLPGASPDALRAAWRIMFDMQR
jgi:hypothetical protein